MERTTTGIDHLKSSSIIEDRSDLVHVSPPLFSVPPRTSFLPEAGEKTSRMQDKIIEPIPSRLEGLPIETIRAWWFGRVTKVNLEEDYFEAILSDPFKAVEMIAEFDIEKDQEQDLRYGMRFIFFVVTEHGHGSPRTTSGIEFIPPYIWQEKDDEKAKKLEAELFPNELPFSE